MFPFPLIPLKASDFCIAGVRLEKPAFPSYIIIFTVTSTSAKTVSALTPGVTVIYRSDKASFAVCFTEVRTANADSITGNLFLRQN